MRPFLAHLIVASIYLFAAPSHAVPPYPQTDNFGVPFSKDESWCRQCMRVEARRAPALPAGQAAPAHCNAASLYYRKRNQAVTSSNEWNQVRACALAHDDHAVLMMLYANGFGVPRDSAIALYYACGLDFIAKTEMEVRAAHLAQAQPSGAVFDQCDDITSGHMGTICSAIRESQAHRVRNARMKRAVHALPDKAQAALKTLRAAADTYIAAAALETDMQGTGAPAFAIGHKGKLNEQFMAAVLDVTHHSPRSAAAPAPMRREAPLNAVYRRLMRAPSVQDGWPDRIGRSTIERSDVRNAEQGWLAYRRAFIAFARTVPGAMAPATLNALLTNQRLAELKSIAAYR